MSGKRISAIIALDGEKEFKSAVTSVNKELANLKSESNLVKAQFEGQANTLEALRAKHQVLQKTLETQQKKQEAITNGLKNAKEAYQKVETGLSTLNEKQKIHSKKVQELKSEYENATSRLEKMTKAGKSSEQSIQKQQAVVKSLEEQLKKENSALKEVNEAVTKGEKNYQTAANRVQDWETKLNNANAAVIKANKDLMVNAAYMKEAEKSTDGCAVSIDEFGKKTSNADKNLAKTADAVSNLAGIMVASGVGQKIEEVAGQLYECAEAAAAFESSIAKVATIADTSNISLNEIKNQIMELSGETGEAAENISDLAYDAISATGDTVNSVKMAGNATKLATAGFTTSSSALSVLVTAMNSYKLSADEMTNISDSLVQTQNLGVLTIDKLSSSMGKAIASASAYNIDIYNLESGYVSLTKSGISVEESTTYLSGMFSELGKSSSEVSKILQEQTGKSFGQLMNDGYTLADVLEILYDSVNGNSEALMNLWSSQEAGKASNAIINQGITTFNNNLGELKNSIGATDSAYKKIADTSEYAKKKMENSVENLKKAIGDQLNGSLKDMYKAGAKAFDWATDFVKKYPGVVQAVGALVTALGTLTAIIAGFTVVQKIIPLIKAFNLALAANPAMFVATAITTLITSMAAYKVLAGDAASETREFCESMEQQRETIRSTAEEYQESIASAQSQWEANRLLVDQLYELADAENKTAGEKAVMKGIVEELAEDIPELAAAFDEESGSIKLTKDELYKLIDAKEDYALAVAAQDSLQEFAQNVVDAQIMIQQTEDAIKDLADEYKKFGVEMDENTLELKFTDTTVPGKGLDELADKYAKLQEQRQENIKLKEEEENNLESAKTVLASYGKTIEDTAGNVSDLSSAEKEAADATKSATEEQAEAYEELKQSISDSVSNSISMFDEFSGGEKITSKEILENLNSQIDGMTNWADNMETLAGAAGYGMTEEFYNYLAEMGPQSANLVQALVDSLNGNTGQFVEICQKWADAMNLEEPLSEQTAGAYQKVMEETEAFEQQYTDEVGNLYRSSSRKANETLASEAKTLQETAKATGANHVISYKEGFASKEGELKSQVTGTMNSAMAPMTEELPTKMYNGGVYAGQGAAQGVKDSTPEAVQAVVDMANSMNTAFRSTLQINSPSRVFTENGQYIAQGIAVGISAAKNEAQQAIKELCIGVMDTAQSELDIHSPSKKFKDNVGAQISRGVAFGIAAKKGTAIKNAKSLADDVYKAASTWLTEYKKTHTVSLEDEKYYWKQVSQTVKKGTQAYKDAMKKVTNIENYEKKVKDKVKDAFGVSWYTEGSDGKKQKKSAEDYYSEVYQKASQYFDNYSTLHNTTLQQEEYYWQQVLKKMKKGTQAYVDATKQLKTVQAQIKEQAQQEKESNKQYALSGGALDAYKTYYKVSERAEVQYWNIVRKKFKEGTAERIEADRKYYEAKEAYNDRLEELNEEYYENCKEVNEKLVDDIQELTDAYNDAVKDRKDSIYSSFDLFDEFQSTSASGSTLLYNLKTQVAGFADWEQQLQKLGDKNILSDELLQELADMGPEASASIHALNQLSEEQLREYEQLWEQKNALAESQAVKENEQLRQETQTKIEELKSAAQQELAAYKEEYRAAVAEVKTEIEAPLKDLAKQATKVGEDTVAGIIAGIKDQATKKDTTADLKKVNANISDQLGKLEKAGKTIGDNTLQGILDGLNNKKKITGSAKSMVNALKTAIQNAADIHSPSRLFKKAIGENIADGVAVGIKDETKTVNKAGTDMISSLLEQQAAQMQKQQEKLKAYAASVESSVSMTELNQLISVAPVQQVNASVDNSSLIAMMSEMISIMQTGFENMANLQIVTDTGALIGETSTGMSEQFAMMCKRIRR